MGEIENVENVCKVPAEQNVGKLKDYNAL